RRAVHTIVKLITERRVARWSAIALTLALAATLRFQGLDWDQHQRLHPDERFLSMVTVALGWPSSPAEYLDEQRSPLNPRNTGFSFYPYGTLPLAIAKGLGLASQRTGYDEVTLLGRAISAAFDLGTVALVYLLAIALYGNVWIALLASAFYA